MIAALFVEKNGPYFGLENVVPYDIERNAFTYEGPYPVIAHPPCERWGRYWWGGPSSKVRYDLGADGGCFAYALRLVEQLGGVLEHPEGSHAWRVYGLDKPPFGGGWIETGRGFTCCVEQGHYGHKARKKTWLYYVGSKKPFDLVWGPSQAVGKIDKYHWKRYGKERGEPRPLFLTKKERKLTPIPFRDMLIELVTYGTMV